MNISEKSWFLWVCPSALARSSITSISVFYDPAIHQIGESLLSSSYQNLASVTALLSDGLSSLSKALGGVLGSSSSSSNYEYPDFFNGYGYFLIG